MNQNSLQNCRELFNISPMKQEILRWEDIDASHIDLPSNPDKRYGTINDEGFT